jgi:hypothetical protein
MTIQKKSAMRTPNPDLQLERQEENSTQNIQSSQNQKNSA